MLWNMITEFMTLRTTEVKKTTKYLFLIFANAKRKKKKTCEYSHLQMRIFGPSLNGMLSTRSED